MKEERLQELIDRQGIVDVFNRYATGIDGRDHELYRSCFTDRLAVEMGPDPKTGPAEDWCEQAFNAVGVFQTTQHLITNHEVAIHGDEADGRAYLWAMHYNPGSTFTVGGYYDNHFVRAGDEWKIDRLKLVVTWSQAVTQPA